tara:strand:- start:4248 stop:4694 length:447 start_codon:yes stop_codon:yes gene_type:complete
MKTGVSVGDAMTQNPVTVDSELTIMAAAKILIDERVGSLLVTSGKQLLGIVTEKDIVRIIAQGLNAKSVTIDQIMTSKLHTIEPDTDLYDAVHYMKKHKIRRLPVLHKGNMLGLLTTSDVLKFQPILYEILYDWGKMQASKKMEDQDD